jgi:hypothetical protein
MDHRFEEEFYRSAWQRVLPAGPYGIQPYVRTARRARGLPTGRQGLIGLLAPAARGVVALGRSAVMGMATRPLPLTTAPRAQGQGSRSPLPDADAMLFNNCAEWRGLPQNGGCGLRRAG